MKTLAIVMLVLYGSIFHYLAGSAYELAGELSGPKRIWYRRVGAVMTLLGAIAGAAAVGMIAL